MFPFFCLSFFFLSSCGFMAACRKASRIDAVLVPESREISGPYQATLQNPTAGKVKVLGDNRAYRLLIEQ
jgi:hypothetical protein